MPDTSAPIATIDNAVTYTTKGLTERLWIAMQATDKDVQTIMEAKDNLFKAGGKHKNRMKARLQFADDMIAENAL